MKKIYLVLIISLMSLHGFSQQQYWNWYFGYHSALNFSTGIPVAVTGDSMHQAEGSASISDAAGHLLFYTDGDTVWDNTHSIMPNGAGLMGDWSSTQAALIIPKPDSANIYYVFNAAASIGANGIRYSEVDMTLNGGHGDITVKNVPLVTPACEKLTAVKHCNGHDYWVVVHNYYDNAFYAYLVTNAGVAPPVITHIGMSVSTSSNYIGYLKASPNGQKMAVAWEASGTFELYDFDNGTGVLSNLKTLYISFNVGPYGISFSPDNTKMYTSVFTNTGSSVFQFDISSNNQATILTTRVTIANSPNAYGALQIGPDNKIYIAEYNSPTLSVINAPNALGLACNCVLNSLPLAPGISSFGLPNMVDAIVTLPSTIVIDTTVCSSSLVLTATAIGSTYLWSTGETSASISITNNGAYWVQVQSPNGCAAIVTLTDTFHVTISAPFTVNLGADTTLCNGDSITLNAGNPGNQFLWSNGATTQFITVSATGNYYVQVTNGGCTVSDSIGVNVLTFIHPHSSFLVDTLSGCKPLIIHITNTSTDATSYWWHFSEGGTSTVINPVHSYSHSGSYSITLVDYDTTACGIFTDTSVQIFYYIVFLPPQIPTITQLGDTLISSTAYQYQWFLGNTSIANDTNQQFTIPGNGCYHVEITDSNGCKSKSDSICFTTGINEVSSSHSIVIYPNPNDGNFVLDYHLATANAVFVVTDLTGRVVFKNELVGNAGKERIDISSLCNGMYFYQVMTANETLQGKIVVVVRR